MDILFIKIILFQIKYSRTKPVKEAMFKSAIRVGICTPGKWL